MIYTLSIVAVIYTSLVALMQTDMKKLIAYSSVAHMGIVTIGIFTLNPLGIQGSIIQMLSHGLVSAALFMCVGVVYDRLHSRDIDYYGGLVQRMPGYAFVFMLFMLASVGLPGTSGFVGEILVLIGVFQVNQWVALVRRAPAWCWCRLHALALSPRHLRRSHQGASPDDPGSSAARDRELRALDHPGAVDGDLSGPVPRSDGRVRRSPPVPGRWSSRNRIGPNPDRREVEMMGIGMFDLAPAMTEIFPGLHGHGAFDVRRFSRRGAGQPSLRVLARDHGADGRPLHRSDGRRREGDHL